MKRHSRMFVACLGILSACDVSVSRPDQDNFLVEAKRIGGSKLTAELGQELHASVDEYELPTRDNKLRKFYRLDGSGFVLILDSVPDNRCDPYAGNYEPYLTETYRVDLVYNTTRPERRKALRKALIETVRRLALPIKRDEGCKA